METQNNLSILKQGLAKYSTVTNLLLPTIKNSHNDIRIAEMRLGKLFVIKKSDVMKGLEYDHFQIHPKAALSMMLSLWDHATADSKVVGACPFMITDVLDRPFCLKMCVYFENTHKIGIFNGDITSFLELKGLNSEVKDESSMALTQMFAMNVKKSGQKEFLPPLIERENNLVPFYSLLTSGFGQIRQAFVVAKTLNMDKCEISKFSLPVGKTSVERSLNRKLLQMLKIEFTDTKFALTQRWDKPGAITAEEDEV